MSETQRSITVVSELPTVEIPTQMRFLRDVQPPETWGAWLELMGSSTTFTQKMGLLHGAFDVNLGRREYDSAAGGYVPYAHAERLKFFFEIADGWTDASLFDWRTPEERFSGAGFSVEENKYFIGHDKNGYPIERRESEQRQVLARKAFDMLVANFFKMPGIREDTHFRSDEEMKWIKDFIFGPVFPVAQHFFRVEANKFGRTHVCNLSGHHDRKSNNELLAVEFLLKLPKFLWTWKDPDVSYWGKSPEDKAREENEKKEVLVMRAIVDNAKPWMVRVLAELRQLGVLEQWILQLDAPCLAVLKEIALRGEFNDLRHPVIKDRKVATLDEACYLGSPAAWFLKKYELIVREHKRLDKILSNERKKQELERENAALSRS